MCGEDPGISPVASEDAEVVSLLDDQYARLVLALTSEEPLAADALTDRLDAAPSTVYDRLDRLVDHDLITEQQQLDPNGNHYKIYRARLDQVVIELTANGFEVIIDREPSDPADRLTDAFDDLRQ